jgi:glycosyltransferase involved in cell wall biosynthesis
LILKPVVLQLIDSFHQGGSERQALQLTRLLHDSGHFRVLLACLNPDGVLRSEFETLDLGEVPAFPLTAFYNPQAFSQMRRFARYLKTNEIQVLHTHDFYTNIFGMFAGAVARLPVRVASRRETEGIRTPAKRWVERRAYNCAHAIIANAEAVREQVIKEGVPADKVVTLYNGMDTRRVAPRPVIQRAEVISVLGLPGDARLRFVSIVANMRHAMKDQTTFLRAAQHVREVVPDAAFVLAGEGELMGELKSLAASLGLQRHAFFIGHCQQVADLLALSDVCVLSSKGVEGFSNSILEYMAAARPVVATDVGGAREAIIEGETGYLVRSGDDRMMAERIISLMRHPEKARAMGERGRRVVEEKFSCESQLRRTEELYDNLLAGRSLASAGSSGKSAERTT